MHILTSVLILLAAANMDRPNVVPDLIMSRESAITAPIWVSSAAAFDARGQLRSELFHPLYVRSIERHREHSRRNEGVAPNAADGSLATPPPCSSFHAELPQHFPDGKVGESLEALNRHALGIYEGTIVDIEPGFFGGQPASLLIVDVTTTIRASPAFDATRHLYIYYPIIEFVSGETRFCSRALYNDYAPKTGDQIILYALHRPLDANRRLVHIESRDIFFQSSDRLVVPRALRADPGVTRLRTLGDLRETIRASARPLSRTEKE